MISPNHIKESSERNNVLLIDHSGRGHAFAELFTRTDPSVHIFYAPGCVAIDELSERITSVPQLSLSDPYPMVEFAIKHAIQFAFVANTAALAAGFVDVFREHGIAAIGPDKRASRLEASKAETKLLCTKYEIPVAAYEIFDNYENARQYALSNMPVVIKADGLCGGNGTFICDTAEQVDAALQRLMVNEEFGDAGKTVVIEEKLNGIELLFFALTDGHSSLMLPMAVDYPMSDDGDLGVVCGGMGSFSPNPFETSALINQFQDQVLSGIMRCIKQEELEYTGAIYVGCMLVEQQLYVLEINVRMGEPESEVILPRINTNFYDLCIAILKQELDTNVDLRLDNKHYCDVVATQGPTRQISKGKNKGWYKGWPFGRHGKGYAITGLDAVDRDSCLVFIGQSSVHPEKGLVTDGGRCLHVVGMGDTREEAVRNAYANISKISFNGIRYRTDIGILHTSLNPDTNLVSTHKHS